MQNTAELNGSLPLIVKLLFDQGLLDSKKLVELSEFQSKDTSPVEAILVKKGLARDHDIAEAYAEYLVLPLFELPANASPPDFSLAGLLPEKLCRDQLIVPVALEGRTLQIAFASPNEMLIIDEVQLVTGMMVQSVIAARSVIEGLIEALYSGKGSANSFMTPSEDFEQVDDDKAEVVEDDSDEVLHLDHLPHRGGTAA